MDGRIACRVGATLGEGPVWDARDASLWFVDIKQRHVHRWRPGDATTTRWDAPAQIGWVLPADDGAFLAGLQTGVHRFDPADGRFTPIVDPEPERPGNRLNDATVAPDGAVWLGTMDDNHVAATGRVHRFFEGQVVGSALPPVPITNGPAISPDGTTLYAVDTVGGVIFAVPLGDGGVLGEPRVFATIDAADGNPDGASVDSGGRVWVAIWGGSEARCYAPDGALVRRVRFPATQITKVAFGGADLRTGYATSASIGLSEAERAAQPQAGDVFAFDTDVPGLVLPLARAG